MSVRPRTVQDSNGTKDPTLLVRVHANEAWIGTIRERSLQRFSRGREGEFECSVLVERDDITPPASA
ncbi:hypothetical protein M747DRAFT_124154 [Aspergillus niger ATCC 13496]|nr:hypothetical protein M747DRAFT_124154 [Aspergillus niger ATCC 13496]